VLDRDQGKALQALAKADQGTGSPVEVTVRSNEPDEEAAETGATGEGQPTVTVATDMRVALLERGRVASLGGITALI
jgi:hypothetical protein